MAFALGFEAFCPAEKWRFLELETSERVLSCEVSRRNE